MLLISALFHRNLFEKYKIVEVTISRFSHIFLTHRPVKDNNESNKHLFIYQFRFFSFQYCVKSFRFYKKDCEEHIYFIRRNHESSGFLKANRKLK